jgi:Mlc titration factor MtfA (ptsG expression regulator)
VHYARLPLDAYAGDDPAEFFAVSSETFFVDPARLRMAFPDWYQQLVAFYRQDPLHR